MLKKLISSCACVRCNDPCCSFHFFEGNYAPIFTKEEMERVIERGFKRSIFRKAENGLWKIRLKRGRRFLQCPFFSRKRCQIYDIAPFDCKLWPFYIMHSKDKKKVFLTIDITEDCPAINKISANAKERYASYLKRYLQSKSNSYFFKRNPGMIYPYNKDFKALCELKMLKGR